jgi:hypothetical protein
MLNCFYFLKLLWIIASYLISEIYFGFWNKHNDPIQILELIKL